MSAARWDRLAASLADAGLGRPVQVDALPYSEVVYGRARHGTTRSITLIDGDTLVGVHDAWWRKNPDIWIGYQVHVENRRDGIVRRTWPVTKKRSEVAAAVREALALDVGVDR